MNKKLQLLLLLFPFLSFSQSNFKTFQSTQRVTMGTFITELKQSNDLSDEYEFVVLSDKTDRNGISHAYTQQYYKGIPIENAFYSFHSKNGFMVACNGSLKNEISSNTINPTISPNFALNIAVNSISAKQYSWQNPSLFNVIESEKSKRFSSEPIPELVYYEVGSEFKLCFKVEVLALEPQGRYLAYVDANTGEVLNTINISTHVTGTCETNYHGVQDIDFDETSPGQYQLTDATRNIQTYLLPDNSIDYNSATIPTSSFIDWSDISNNNALDVQWSSQVVYDYLSLNGIQGYDGQNAPIISYVNYGNSNGSKNNAFWNGTFLTYGSGGGNVFPGPLTSMDVVAHEIGHAVTENYGNGLLYFGESGAMNESYSDIIAAAVEHYINTSGNYNGLMLNEWLISDLNGDGIRDLSNPNTNDKPDTYEGDFWADTSSNFDNGGVHINSGVGNFWFYLLANGGSGTNDSGFSYSVNGLGIDLAFEIALDAYNYLIYTSSYEDWRSVTEFVAGLNYECSVVQEVIKAWEAVGVGNYNESCSLIAQIDMLDVTQFCIGSNIEFTGAVGFEGVSSWSLNGVPQDSNIISFLDEGFHAVTLTNTYPNGGIATDEIEVYITECSPIQSHKNKWYFGNGFGFDFSTGIAEKTNYPYQTSESTIVYSDDQGTVKFYIADIDLDNTSESGLIDPTNNSVVTSLDPINLSSLQLGTAVSNPQGNLVNVLMANGIENSAVGLYRLIVDVTNPSPEVNLGLAPVGFPSGYQLNDDGAIWLKESLISIPSCNENIFWIIGQSRSPRRTLVYKLDFTSNIQGDLIFEQAYNNELNVSNPSIFSFEVSPNGNYIFALNKLFEFNRQTGELDFLVEIPFEDFPSRYTSFGPNSRFLYLEEGDKIYQYDVLSNDILSSQSLIYELEAPVSVLDIKLGPDNKVYFSHRLEEEAISLPVRYVGVINKPDIKQVNNSVAVNPIAYRFTPGFFFVFPSFSEAEKVDVVPLDFSYGENGCFNVAFNSSGCRPYYNWDFGDSNLSNQQNPEHTFSGTGDYEVSLTSVVSGVEVTVTKTITIGFDTTGLEVLGPDEACESDTILNGPLNFSEYQWSLPNGGGIINNQGDQFVNITWDSLGDKLVHLIITNDEGCTALLTKTITVLNVDCDYNLGVQKNLVIQEVSIYPNPTSNNLFVKANTFIEAYSIYDLKGSLLGNKTLVEENLNFKIDVSEFSQGVYFIKFSNENSSIIKRIIKN
ncbi:M4 family metallopeptidase [Ichthyenterobacterium sp. W332]|uniref:M4 family metallopeptidase n=1 Tax=Microcosmobacter mediterraneus TaxID=3075607 RepID=A0ABU2YL30_9FLAO|nr:M4 family metallopeptidase [Ichthyenterobacterium sp. W332]MDT0558762.1 M4 family metallopeptidase [Ichthyenterobacterium sp. W332]